jgi:hypothetical protein
MHVSMPGQAMAVTMVVSVPRLSVWLGLHRLNSTRWPAWCTVPGLPCVTEQDRKQRKRPE